MGSCIRPDGNTLQVIKRATIMLQLLTIVALAEAAAASSYARNINYHSPSFNHPSLGISIHKVNKRNEGSPPVDAKSLNFTHGVASEDSYPESVILWTRCAPMQDDAKSNTIVSGYVSLYNPVPIYFDTDEHKPVSTAPICVSYKVATNKALKKMMNIDTAYTSSDINYTLKVRTQISEETVVLNRCAANSDKDRSYQP